MLIFTKVPLVDVEAVCLAGYEREVAAIEKIVGVVLQIVSNFADISKHLRGIGLKNALFLHGSDFEIFLDFDINLPPDTEDAVLRAVSFACSEATQKDVFVFIAGSVSYEETKSETFIIWGI